MQSVKFLAAYVSLSSQYENAPILGAAALAIKEIEKDNNITARRKIF